MAGRRAVAPLAAQLAALSDAELEDALVASQRHVNEAESRRASLIRELLNRARGADQAPGAAPDHRPEVAHPCQEEFVGDHVAVLLGCTRAVAHSLLDVAIEVAAHPTLERAWHLGKVDSRKVGVMTEALRPLDPSIARSLVDSAIDYSVTHTAPQLRVWLDRRVLRADPSLATIRRKRASGDRRITLTPLADGMAELAAYLPSVQARRLFETVDAVARESDGDDLRSTDQRRADALVDLVSGRAEPPQVAVNVVVTAETLLETESTPAWVSGVGPVTPDEATALMLAGETTWRRLMADDVTGVLTDVSERRYRPSAQLDRAVRARDGTCRFPGCRRPALGTATGTDLDHTRPWPEGDTSAANLAVLCRRHHRLKHAAGWSVVGAPDGRLTWTTPGGRTVVTTPWEYVDPPYRPPSDRPPSGGAPSDRPPTDRHFP